jgi:hypothetical protein
MSSFMYLKRRKSVGMCVTHAPGGGSMPKGGATPRNYQYQQKTSNLAAALHPAALHGSIRIDCHDTTTNELTFLAIAKSFNTVE